MLIIFLYQYVFAVSNNKCSRRKFKTSCDKGNRQICIFGSHGDARKAPDTYMVCGVLLPVKFKFKCCCCFLATSYSSLLNKVHVNILAHANNLWKFNRYEHGFLGAVEEFANHREIYRPGSICSYMWLHTVVFFPINVEKTLES